MLRDIHRESTRQGRFVAPWLQRIIIIAGIAKGKGYSRDSGRYMATPAAMPRGIARTCRVDFRSSKTVAMVEHGVKRIRDGALSGSDVSRAASARGLNVAGFTASHK